MGIVTEKRRVCDVCNNGANVKQYRITFLGDDGRSLSVDLCEDDSRPLRHLRELMPHGKRSRPRGQRVVSPAEVEAARTTRKKPATPPAKRAAPKKKT